MKITKIELQKQRKNRCSVFIDETFAFGLYIEDLYLLGLKEGQILTTQEREKIENQILYSRGKDKALHLLSYRARTEKEVRQRLQDEEYPNTVIDQVIEFLYEYSFLDDQRYAEQFIRSKLRSKPLGKRMILHQLQQKGISKADAEEALTNQEIDETAAAYKLVEKRIDTTRPATFKEKKKMFSYLQGRGFSYDIIREVLSQITWED
ncbi:MAG: regulatory protein RecX [Epulopiscium sp.]|nr:regulatory protein RecX [Candidatus Epulonipiscium sp.]